VIDTISPSLLIKESTIEMLFQIIIVLGDTLFHTTGNIQSLTGNLNLALHFSRRQILLLLLAHFLQPVLGRDPGRHKSHPFVKAAAENVSKRRRLSLDK
jgi:hypothetical protein